jgi:hypothetical protein
MKPINDGKRRDRMQGIQLPWPSNIWEIVACFKSLVVAFQLLHLFPNLQPSESITFHLVSCFIRSASEYFGWIELPSQNMGIIFLPSNNRKRFEDQVVPTRVAIDCPVPSGPPPGAWSRITRVVNPSQFTFLDFEFAITKIDHIICFKLLSKQ